MYTRVSSDGIVLRVSNVSIKPHNIFVVEIDAMCLTTRKTWRFKGSGMFGVASSPIAFTAGSTNDILVLQVFDVSLTPSLWCIDTHHRQWRVLLSHRSDHVCLTLDRVFVFSTFGHVTIMQRDSLFEIDYLTLSNTTIFTQFAINNDHKFIKAVSANAGVCVFDITTGAQLFSSQTFVKQALFTECDMIVLRNTSQVLLLDMRIKRCASCIYSGVRLSLMTHVSNDIFIWEENERIVQVDTCGVVKRTCCLFDVIREQKTNVTFTRNYRSEVDIFVGVYPYTNELNFLFSLEVFLPSGIGLIDERYP